MPAKYPNAGTESDPLSLAKANNLSDLTNASTARSNLGLGSAATQASSAFDAAGAATSAVASEASIRSAADTTLTTAVGVQTNYVGQRALGMMQSDLCDVSVAFLTDSVGAESFYVSGASATPVEWCYKLAVTWAAAYPLYSVDFFCLDQSAHKYVAPLRIQTGTGTHVLRLYQAGWGGNYTLEPMKYLDNCLTSPLLTDGVTRNDGPDLVFVATGHNYSQNAVDRKHATLLTCCETITAALPNAELVLVAQNPEWNDVPRLAVSGGAGTFTVTVGGQTTTSLAYNASAATVKAALEALSTVGSGNVVVGAPTSSVYVLAFTGKPGRWPTTTATGSGGCTVAVSNYTNGMYDWPRVMRRLAAMRGFGYISVYDAYRALEAYPGQLTSTPNAVADSQPPDGTHPTQAGYQCFADTVWSRMSATQSPAYRAQETSTFSQPTAQNLLTNGDFSDWTGTNPAGWTPAASTTLTKDSTYYESPATYGMLVANSGTAVAYCEQTITGAALTPLLGQWVTLTTRGRNNSSSDIQGCIAKLNDGVNAAVDTGTSDEGLQTFLTRSVMLKVAPTCSSLSIRLYGDTGNDSDSTTATFSQACLVRGMVPQLMVTPQVAGKAYVDTQDASNLVTAKAYTDTSVAAAGAHWVDLVATSGLGTLTGSLTVDGVATSTGTRVLYASGGVLDGIWTANNSGAWTRATDCAAGSVYTTAAAPLVRVRAGNTYQQSAWMPNFSGSTYTVGTDTSGWIQTPKYASILAINNAKGAIPVGLASGQSAQTVGSDGNVLTADSTQTNGIKWAAPTIAIGSVTGIKSRTIIAEGSAQFLPADSVAAYALVPGQKTTPAKLTSGVEVFGQFYFDPADWQETGKTLKVFIESEVTVNATASASSTLLFTLWTLTSPIGGAAVIDVTAAETDTGLRPTVYNAGAITANLQERRVGAQRTPPAAGFYSLGCTLGAAALTASSAVMVRARLVGIQT